MSKKPKKSRHRVPVWDMRSDEISDRYQIEVDYATNRLMRRYEKALKFRDAAQQRLTKAIESKAKDSRLAELRRQLEIREYELMEIVKLMQPGIAPKSPGDLLRSLTVSPSEKGCLPA